LACGLSHDLKELVDPQAGVGKQELIVIEFLAELKKVRNRSIDRKSIGHRNGAKIIEQKVHAGASGESAYVNRFGVPADAEWRRLIFEIAGSTPLMRDGLALGYFMDPLFGQLKIDRAGRIVGKSHEAGAILNYPFGFQAGHDAYLDNFGFSEAKGQVLQARALGLVLVPLGISNARPQISNWVI
jgi:hypothetical protein